MIKRSCSCAKQNWSMRSKDQVTIIKGSSSYFHEHCFLLLKTIMCHVIFLYIHVTLWYVFSRGCLISNIVGLYTLNIWIWNENIDLQKSFDHTYCFLYSKKELIDKTMTFSVLKYCFLFLKEYSDQILFLLISFQLDRSGIIVLYRATWGTLYVIDLDQLERHWMFVKGFLWLQLCWIFGNTRDISV